MLNAVFCATSWECSHALKTKEYKFEKICAEPFEVWRNRTKIVVITGMGLVAASAAFAWAAENFKFGEALNVGAAGLVRAGKGRGKIRLGESFKISSVACLEPYNERVFKLARSGKTLVSSSRIVSTAEEREYAGKFGELVDMEGYALASLAEVYGKKISMVKMVTDFSPDCDIFANIIKLSEKFAPVRELWT